MWEDELKSPETTERYPSVYKLWVLAKEQTETENDRLDRYYELLAQYGYREKGIV